MSDASLRTLTRDPGADNDAVYRACVREGVPYQHAVGSLVSEPARTLAMSRHEQDQWSARDVLLQRCPGLPGWTLEDDGDALERYAQGLLRWPDPMSVALAEIPSLAAYTASIAWRLADADADASGADLGEGWARWEICRALGTARIETMSGYTIHLAWSEGSPVQALVTAPGSHTFGHAAREVLEAIGANVDSSEDVDARAEWLDNAQEALELA